MKYLACALLLLVVEITLAAEAQYRPGGPPAGVAGYHFQDQAAALYPGAVEYFSSNYGGTHPLFDRQSQVKLWTAPQLPMTPSRPLEQITPPTVRAYRGSGPFPVVRCGVRNPIFNLDCGELAPSLYAVRVIATVDPEKLRPFRAPIFVSMKINDGIDGGTSTYRVRIGYADDFFSVAEIYFHAPARRAYKAELWVDAGSTIDLLVNAISLDDTMAGTQRKAWKTGRTMHSDAEIANLKAGYSSEEKQAIGSIPALSPEQRLVRDQDLWNWMPPLNSAFVATFFQHADAPMGAAGKSMEQIEAEFGKWEAEANHNHGLVNSLGLVPGYDDGWQGAFLVNKKLNLRYTMDDYRQGKPLPDPYPFKDSGQGLYYPDAKDPNKGRYFPLLGIAVQERLRHGNLGWSGAAKLWQKSGNEHLGRDVAVLLVRYAWQFPAIDCANSLSFVARQPCYNTLDLRCYNRMSKSYWAFNYDHYLAALYAYDLIFEYIQGNQELAHSLNRFIPTIRTPEDVIAFLDTYLVQHTAKRTLRGHDHTWRSAIATIGAAVGNRELADAWVKPYADSLLPFVINDTDRNGTKNLGSSFYSHGEGASEHAAALDAYIRAGGDPALSLLKRTPRPLYQAEWTLDTIIGGWDWLRIGDVSGPGAPFGRVKAWMADQPVLAWRWTGEPRYAWIIRNVVGRTDETEAQWKEIEGTAATVKRAPWLENRSRVIDNWAGILESGVQHDDPRFRRAAYVRVGRGSGHAHADPLDLHMLQGGLHAVIEGGQRSGYSKPNDKLLRVHSTVEVQGPKTVDLESTTDSYVRALTDAEGSRYMEAVAVPPPNATLYRRQVAMIDVDEGEGSTPFTVKQQVLEEPWPRGVKAAHSYLLDVFRVAGGQMHSYGFNGTVNDEFQWNAEDMKAVEHVKPTANWKTDAEFLAPFELTAESKQAGTAPDTVQATWRMVRFEKDTLGKTSEQESLGFNFDPQSPLRYTRLHLLGARGLELLKADVLQTKVAEEQNLKNPGQPPQGYRWTRMYARRLAEAGLAEARDLQTVFVGVVEPYLGEPFITSTKLLDVANNESDARRAVAVEVKLKNGRTDVVFADGRPENQRQVGDMTIRGEYAMVSTDQSGLRQATLSGGTILQTPQVRIALPAARHVGKILRTDHPGQAIEIDSPAWAGPAGLARAGEVVEILGRDRATSFTLASPATATQTGSRLVFTRDAIASVDPSGRAKYAYAEGDTAHLPAWVNIRRLAGGDYEITGNSDAEVRIGRGSVIRFSAQSGAMIHQAR